MMRTGKVVWRVHLPAGAQANPMTYRIDPTGKQYVVITAGGHQFLKTEMGDSIVAFALNLKGFQSDLFQLKNIESANTTV